MFIHRGDNGKTTGPITMMMMMMMTMMMMMMMMTVHLGDRARNDQVQDCNTIPQGQERKPKTRTLWEKVCARSQESYDVFRIQKPTSSLSHNGMPL